MEIQDFSHHLKGIEAALQRQLERDLPKKLGNLAIRMSMENFQKESFFGRGCILIMFLIRSAHLEGEFISLIKIFLILSNHAQYDKSSVVWYI